MSQEEIGNWAAIIITVGLISIGLISMLIGQLARLREWWREGINQARAPRHITSSRWRNSNDDDPLYADNSPATTTPQNNNNRVATPQLDSNALLQTRAADLAKMVHAGKIGETEGIRLIFGCAPSSSNPKYIAARAALKKELEKLTNPYPYRTPEQEQRRKELELAS